MSRFPSSAARQSTRRLPWFLHATEVPASPSQDHPQRILSRKSCSSCLLPLPATAQSSGPLLISVFRIGIHHRHTGSCHLQSFSFSFAAVFHFCSFCSFCQSVFPLLCSSCSFAANICVSFVPICGFPIRACRAVASERRQACPP